MGEPEGEDQAGGACADDENICTGNRRLIHNLKSRSEAHAIAR
jgi:hypothetical protein